MSGYIYEQETGHLLSAEMLRIAEILQDYNPTLDLVWIPPEDRRVDDTELPFAVRCTPSNGAKPYIVFQLREDEVDHRVLERVFEADTSRNDVLSMLERREAALRLVEMKRKMDEAEERKEFVKSVFSSRKSVYKHNGVEYR
jgi:hypothetical protein